MANEPGYQKGYAAGRRRTEREEAEARQRFADQAKESRSFRDAVFISVVCKLEGWKMDDVSVSTIDQHVELAWRIAKRAAATRPTP